MTTEDVPLLPTDLGYDACIWKDLGKIVGFWDLHYLSRVCVGFASSVWKAMGGENVILYD